MKKSLLLLSLISFSLLGCAYSSPNAAFASNRKSYQTYLNKKIKHIDKSTYSPTLIFKGDNVEDLTNKEISDYYYDVLIDVDDNLNVDLDNKKIDLTTYLDTYIKGKFVPIINIKDSNVTKFLNYYHTTYAYFDMMIMSSSLDALTKIHLDNETNILGSVYNISSFSLEINQFDNWKYVRDANKVGCNTILLNANDPNFKVAANYISSMTKSAWAISNNEIMDANIPTSGCTGIISDNPERTLSILEKFAYSGRLSPQKLAAHRGITTYANENSLSSCMFASSEGASHIEIDLQICADGEIVLCHNSQTNYNSDKNGWYFVNLTYEQLQKATLNDYSVRYQETYSKLSSLIENIMYTDVIVICELKFDNGSSKAVNNLKCIENLKKVVDSYPQFFGHWFAITFFAPLAEKMQELMPEVPVGYLGGATSDLEKEQGVTGWKKGGGHKQLTDYANKIKFLKYYNLALDETFDEKNGDGQYYFDLTCDFYMARGYLQNTWTYENINHLNNKTNIATSNVVEKCANLIKDFPISSLVMSQDEYNNGKVKVNTLNYNKWKIERECKIIPVFVKEEIFIILYYKDINSSVEYGRYSNVIQVTIQ